MTESEAADVAEIQAKIAEELNVLAARYDSRFLAAALLARAAGLLNGLRRLDILNREYILQMLVSVVEIVEDDTREKPRIEGLPPTDKKGLN